MELVNPEMSQMGRKFRFQAVAISKLVAKYITEDEANKFIRADIRCVCPTCKLEYVQHPLIKEGPAKGFYLACNGNLWKL